MGAVINPFLLTLFVTCSKEMFDIVIVHSEQAPPRMALALPHKTSRPLLTQNRLEVGIRTGIPVSIRLRVQDRS